MKLTYEKNGDYLIPNLMLNEEPQGTLTKYGLMNVKGQLSHNLEIGSDPFGNIARINHALESMPKELAEAQTKLETMEHQLEAAKVEVQKPFSQKVEHAEKLDHSAKNTPTSEKVTNV